MRNFNLQAIFVLKQQQQKKDVKCRCARDVADQTWAGSLSIIWVRQYVNSCWLR